MYTYIIVIFLLHISMHIFHSVIFSFVTQVPSHEESSASSFCRRFLVSMAP